MYLDSGFFFYNPIQYYNKRNAYFHSSGVTSTDREEKVRLLL